MRRSAAPSPSSNPRTLAHHLGGPLPRDPDFLFVEDDPADEELLRVALDGAAVANATVVATVDEALAHLRRRNQVPTITITDLNMPGRDGFALLTAVRDDPALTHTPVVVLSTSDRAQDLTRALALGANAYHVKPANIDDFVALLRCLTAYWRRASLVAP